MNFSADDYVDEEVFLLMMQSLMQANRETSRRENAPESATKHDQQAKQGMSRRNETRQHFLSNGVEGYGQ
jgi:hypothetical protein